MFQRQVHAGDHQVEVFFQACRPVRRRGTLPKDGEDGSFHRLGNCVIGRFHAGAHGGAEGLGIRFLQLGEALGHTRKNAGEDNPGIAARTQEHALGDRIRHLGQVVPAGVAAGLHGHVHVVPGVSVGDGKYVQVVDRLAVLGKTCRSAPDHVQV